MDTELIIICSSFPLYDGESFLALEYKYLQKNFNNVHFIVKGNTKRTVLSNQFSNEFIYEINTELSNYQKLFALFNLFRWTVIVEIIQKPHLGFTKNLQKIKIAIISFYQAKLIKQKIRSLSDKKKNTFIVYSYWCDEGALAAAMLQKEKINFKSCSRVHGWDLYFHVHSVPYLPFRKFIQSHITAIYPISEKGISEIKNTWKVDTHNVHLARLGVEGIPHTGNKRSNKTVVVSCSNVIPLKRIDLLAKTILSFNTPISWIHFGDGPELQNIQKWVQDHMKENHNIQFKGKMNNHEILQFYADKEITVFVNVSSSEGIPVSIMEAMSFGIPVVATNVGGTSEIVNNENGVLLSENPTPLEIKAAIEEVIAHPEKGEVAYKTWNEKYNAEKNYTEFVNQLKSI